MLIMLIGRIVLKNLMTIGDKLLIFFITATVGIMFYKTYFNTPSNQEVVVSISGNPVRMFSHDELFGNGIYRIPLKNGEARIEIDRGRVRILPMSKKLCPRGGGYSPGGSVQLSGGSNAQVKRQFAYPTV